MVFGLLDQGGGGDAVVAKPAVGLSFTAGGGGAGGVGGLAGGLVETVGAALGLGRGSVPLVDQLVSLRLSRRLAPDVDVAELWLAPRDWTDPDAPPLVAVGDTGVIELGLSADDLSKVFTCEIDMVELRGAGLLRAAAANGGRKLARLRLNQSYANRKPGEIIADIAGAAGVEVTGSDAGETLPRYAVDDRQSAYEIIAELSAMAGRLAGFDADGKLALLDQAAPGEVAATLVYGTDIIDFVLADRSPHSGEISLHGAGAADASGDKSWAWLRKELGPDAVVTGEGPPQRRYAAPAARSPEAVAQRAGSAVQAAERARSVSRVRALGIPGLAPGARIILEGVPGGVGNGEYIVVGLVHRMDAGAGLVTDLRVSRIGGGGDLLGSLLGAIEGLL